MAKDKKLFVCAACGTAHNKWQGQCAGCGAWNTLVEERPPADKPGQGLSLKGRGTMPIVSLGASEIPPPRLLSGIPEFDRVCGGGLVAGAAFLVGGDPGIGKSTLLLQLAAKLSHQVS